MTPNPHREAGAQLRFKPGHRYLTKEPVPRSVHVLGPCLIDPDVFVCRPEGMKTSVLMNCGSRFDGKIIGTEIFLDEASEQPA
jgi:hypothetical protein